MIAVQKIEVFIPAVFFALAAVFPVGSIAKGIVFGILLALGWYAAVRIRRPVIAFYGSLGVLLIGMLPLGIR